MRRKSFWLSVILLVSIAGAVLSTLVLLTQHAPAFYLRSEAPPGKARKIRSGAFSSSLYSFATSVGNSNPGDWGLPFTEADINSYFAEDFLTSNLAQKLLPDGISEPRLAIEQDRVRLGFRFGTPPWSTIISVDFRVWLAKAEPNVVVLELQGMHAGALPISAQSLLEDISEALRHYNVQVSWYRHQGNPTAALKFQSEQSRPTAQLLQLDLKPGLVTIRGCTKPQ